MKLLLTGRPGVGKTTVVERLVDLVGERLDLGGFVTRELREGGQRVGFELVPLAGGEARVMAHARFVSRHRVGRYGVDVEMVDYVADTTLGLRPARALYLIDEVGKMECLSARFVRAIERLLAADVALVATVAVAGGGLIGAIKAREDVELLEVTTESREGLPAVLMERIEGMALT